MRSATRITVASFGVLAGLAGIEHGVGEILQGSRPPDAVVIVSWPDTAAFRILGGEPAMTLVPNLLVSGIPAVLMSTIAAGDCDGICTRHAAAAWPARWHERTTPPYMRPQRERR